MPAIPILAAAELPPFLATPLASAFALHDRLHEGPAADFAPVAGTIRGLVTRGEIRIDAALLDRLPALEIIAVFGVGYDGVDVAAALERGVLVTHTPGVLDDDVADLAVALMLCTARRIPMADRFVRDGLWPTGPLPLARRVPSAAGHPRPRTHRAGDRAVRRGIRHVDRLHGPRPGRTHRGGIFPTRWHWPPRATSSS